MVRILIKHIPFFMKTLLKICKNKTPWNVIWDFQNFMIKRVAGRITWPIDGDAGLVFRSAHFATYFKILSVKFEPLCIRPIMSTKADKGDRKREIEQSPMKKKFRDSAISSEDLDSAIASRIELAFKEHQSTLNSVVNSAVEMRWTLCWFQHCANCVRTYSDQ